ncbi:MAG: DUF1080 domain-containing protein [Phycisphaerae bacterium]|nr:DUF1080 domain-containing protein [Phycisphaerae bacterium]
MKYIQSLNSKTFMALCCLLIVFMSTSLRASIVAYWDMADANASDGAYMPGNGSRADLDGDGAMDTDDFVISSADLSGNGNHLTVWTSSWMKWTSDSYKGNYAMTAANSWPAAGTDSKYNPYITGIDAEKITPQAWTIETVFKSSDLSSNRTFVGRDGRYVGGSSSSAAALYFKTQGTDLAIEYIDVSGIRHSVQVAAGLVTDKWYHAAAVSNGTWLRLYLDNTEIGSLDITGTSADTSLALGYGTWSVARGMWSDDHVDRFFGLVDAVAISDSALIPEQFVIRDKIFLTESDNKTTLYSGDIVFTDSYDCVLLEQPSDEVVITITPPAGLSVGNGNGQSENIVFTNQNWNQPQTITIQVADSQATFDQITLIQHKAESNDPDFNQINIRDIKVYIGDDSCGLWGFLVSDFNMDCMVNFEDFSILANLWLNTEQPLELESIFRNWLVDTFNYDTNVFARSIQKSNQPFFINTAKVLNRIDENIYGHFLEHIYNSVNGGLWGDLIWNRSFEITDNEGGIWAIEGDELVQSSLSTDVHLKFGDTLWNDFELTLEAKKIEGSEGFLILFRAPDSENFYWFNIGGWGNTQHAIQKEVNGNRSTITSHITGSINTDQWYNIRILCEGNNFKAYLDDVKIFDYTDIDNPISAGAVGVGTWSTKARFRNIQVKNLTGTTVLYSGLPTVPNLTFGAKFWTVVGSGSASMSTDALNDDYSVQIVANGNAMGIQQDNFKFTQQDYQGSLWMKGSSPAGVHVEFLDGTNVLGQTTLEAPTSNWQEYPFSITPTASTNDGSLRITLLDAGNVKIDQVSMMGKDAIDAGGFRPDLLDAVHGLNPPVIRWPGGYFAERYNWKDGIGPQHTRKKYPYYIWDDQDTNSFGTDEFLELCEAIDSEPIIVINIGSHISLTNPQVEAEYIELALQWMEYCNGNADTTWGALRAANGHPEPYNITYWEIDNEVWFQMNASTYCDKLKAFVPAMQAKATELGVPIKVIACGSNSYDFNWDATVIDNCGTIIDYISIHHYESPNNFKSGPINDENKIIRLANYIASSANPNLEIYNSEWNVQSTDWRTGLYAGGILNAYQRQGEYFTMGGPALFLRHTSASSWDNSFINFDHTGWFPAPNYVVMKLWHDHYAPNRVETIGADTDMNVVSTLSDDAKTLYIQIVNPDSTDKSVEFELDDSFVADSAIMQFVAPGDLYTRNTISNPDAVNVQAKMVGLKGQVIRFVMPAYSAGVVTVKTTQPHKTKYLYSYFQGNGDGLHLAYSDDGLSFNVLKDNTTFVTPNVGSKLMRDPSICQGPDGMFHMVWTTGWTDNGIGIAHSTDLINWSEQKYLSVMEDASYVYNTWAPEIFYDDATGKYLVFWSSTITSGSTNDHRIYYITTEDFVTYTDTALLYDPGFSCIDGFIAKDRDRYALVLKDERSSGKNILITFSENAAGPYDVPHSSSITPGGLWVEGPSIVKVGQEWVCYYDAYTSGYMGGQSSIDLETWTGRRSEISFPNGTRHGTVFKVTQDVLDTLLSQ